MGFELDIVRRLRPQQVIARKNRNDVEKRKRLRKLKLIKLKKNLNGVGRYWSSAEVVERMSTVEKIPCKPDWVTRWRKRLNLGFTREEAIIGKRNQLYEKKCRVGNLEERFRQLSGQRAQFDLKRCQCCSNVWYKCEIFFQFLPPENGNRPELSNICKACSE